MKIIDAHCHIGTGFTYSLSVDDLLKDMDANSVESAVVVPVDRCLAVYNEEGNNETLAAAKKYPERIISFATVNPWYGDKALDELKRCFDAGAAGLKLHPVIQGFSIIDKIVFPVVELAAKYGKPIYIHTGTPVHSTPFQLTELAMRYPEGNFIMGHAAYADYWNDVVDAVKCVPNIFVDTSEHIAVFIRMLYTELGSERLMYGSDAPKTAMWMEIEKITRFIKPEADLENIFNGTISRLLRRS